MNYFSLYSLIQDITNVQQLAESKFQNQNDKQI